MNWHEWVFSGIGTQILYCLISFVVGGAVGSIITVRIKNKQIQKAGNNATQSMTGNTININGNK